MTDLTREGLVELAAKVEQASGPDRELDCEIGCAVAGYYLAEPRYPGAKRMYGYVDGEGSRVEPGNGPADSLIPRYTASLDAAMTLVPERLRWCVDTCGTDRAFSFVEDVEDFSDDATSHKANAATPALALCAAALKARARAMEAGRG